MIFYFWHIDFWQVTNRKQHSLHSQWKVKPDVGSHNKQWLTMQRAREDCGCKKCRGTQQDLLWVKDKGEKPDLLSKTFFFPALKVTHYMAQEYLVQMQLQEGTKPQSPWACCFLSDTLGEGSVVSRLYICSLCMVWTYTSKSASQVL